MLNIIYLKKSDEFTSIDNKNVKKSLNNVDAFYCTNKMVKKYFNLGLLRNNIMYLIFQTLEKVNFDNNSDNNINDAHLLTTKFYKNLPENNLKLLINQHKSQKFLDDQQKINEYMNIKSNLRKV